MVKMKLNPKPFRWINRGYNVISYYNIGFKQIEDVIDFTMVFFSCLIRFEVVNAFQIFQTAHIASDWKLDAVKCTRSVSKFRNTLCV